MRVFWGWLSLFLFVFVSACGVEPPVVSGLRSDLYRGAWFAKNDDLATLSAQARGSLQKMWDLGVRWLALGPRVEMPDIYSPKLSYGSDDQDYRQFIRMARKMGFRILLMPRIESEAFFKPPFPFRADIRMLTNDRWLQFHNVYEAMLVHYAKLAQEEQVGLLVLGLEYRTYVRKFPEQWRRFATTVRKHFKGKITYSANWFKEFEEVKFWDVLDYIAIGAYFELEVPPSASASTIEQAWTPIVETIRKVSEQFKRPVLFSEVGYPSFSDAARFPWKWQSELTRPLDLAHQAASFSAMFRVFSQESWFRGVFLWRFYSSPQLAPTYGYSPSGKPAEKVIQQWFSKQRK